MNKKELTKYIEHQRAYIQLYVQKPADAEFYVEALCRLDGLIDEMIIRLLIFNNPSARDVLNDLDYFNAIDAKKITSVLGKWKIIDSNLLRKIKEFKEIRNRIAHNIHGEYEVAIEESGFYSIKNICHNCEGCREEYFKSKGITDFNKYINTVLTEKVKLGLFIYENLEIAFFNSLKERKPSRYFIPQKK